MALAFRYLGYAASGIFLGAAIFGGCSASDDAGGNNGGTGAKDASTSDVKTDTSTGGSGTGTGPRGTGGDWLVGRSAARPAPDP